MGDGDELDAKRADGDALAVSDDPERNFGRAGLAEPAGLGESGREAGHIHGRAKVWPKLGERPDVVLVSVGDDDPNQILLRLLDEAEIGHDQIDAGQVLAGKRHPKVDHQPLTRVSGPVAVKRTIHADLAQAAERGEHELAVVRHLGSALPRLQSRCGLGVRSRREAEVGRLDALEPALGTHEQATGSIDPLEDALAPAAAALDRDALAKTVDAVKPSGANTIERSSFAPGDERLVEPLDETLEQLARADRPPTGARQTRGRVVNALGRVHAIDANPNRVACAAASEANPFNQDACAFRAVHQQVVRPFEGGVGRPGVHCSARQRHAGDKAELRRERGKTRIDQERAGVEVAPRRHPRPTAASPPGCLLAGDDPQAVRLAGKRAAARLLVGRVDDPEFERCATAHARCPGAGPRSKERLRGRHRGVGDRRGQEHEQEDHQG